MEASQDNSRSQLPGERRLRTRDLDRLVQAIYGRLALVSGEGNQGLDAQQVRQVESHSVALGMSDGTFDGEQRLFQLLGLPQSLRQCSGHTRHKKAEGFLYGLQRILQQRDACSGVVTSDCQFAVHSETSGTKRFERVPAGARDEPLDQT